MRYSDNPLADFNAWDMEQTRQLARLPVCDYCRHEIQDDFYFEINEEIVCEECLTRHFRKAVDDYIE